MIEAVYEAIKQQSDVRKNLSLFRQCLKNETLEVEKQQFMLYHQILTLHMISYLQYSSLK